MLPKSFRDDMPVRHSLSFVAQDASGIKQPFFFFFK